MAEKMALQAIAFFILLCLAGFAGAESIGSLSITSFPSQKTGAVNTADLKAVITADLSAAFACDFEVYDIAGAKVLDELNVPPAGSQCIVDSPLSLSTQLLALEAGNYRVKAIKQGEPSVSKQAYFTVYKIESPGLPDMPQFFALIVCLAVLVLVLRYKKPG